MDLAYTPVEEISQIVADLSSTFQTGKTREVAFRKQQLTRLYNGIIQYKALFTQALKKDLRKPTTEAVLTEIIMPENECVDMLENLDEWTKPRKVATGFINKADHCEVRYEPFGVVLVIGAWNYPILLTLVPLIGAIAAGNCVIVKPSELAPHSAQIVLEFLHQTLDPSCYRVVNGGVKETTVLLENRFDHIIYTGSGNVGKIVMAAAAKHLTPVTLELGGKSPTVVDKQAEIANAARRIIWGKFLNAGQTCIAPDYVLVHQEVQTELIGEMKKVLQEYYGSDPQKSSDFARIISKGHFNRLKKLIDDSQGKLIVGGQLDEDDLYISPTLLLEPGPDSLIMKDEIFGPILPIISFKEVDEAISYINKKEKPLAMYVFTSNTKVAEKIINKTSAGGTTVNDCVMHAAVPELPFGGVGGSGIGSYHGSHSFEQFSHKRAVMVRSGKREVVNNVRYPPYTDQKLNIITFVLTKRLGFGFPIFKTILVASLALLLIRNPNNRIFGSLKVLFGLN